MAVVVAVFGRRTVQKQPPPRTCSRIEETGSMRERSSWDRKARLTRRSLLRAGSAIVSGAALMGSGCATPAAVAPTVVPATAAAAAPATSPTPPQPKRGGTFRGGAFSNPPHLDPHLTATGLLHFTGPAMIYNRLLRFKIG